MIRLNEILDEVAYDGNLGFHEMFLFYNKADDSMVDTLENLIKRKRFKDAWKLVQKVTGTKLKGSQFENKKGKTTMDIRSIIREELKKIMSEGVYDLTLKVKKKDTWQPFGESPEVLTTFSIIRKGKAVGELQYQDKFGVLRGTLYGKPLPNNLSNYGTGYRNDPLTSLQVFLAGGNGQKWLTKYKIDLYEGVITENIKNDIEKFLMVLNKKFPEQEYTADFGSKYTRIIHQSRKFGGKSAWGFVAMVDNPAKNYKQGDILKAASYKAPAKHARGNIYTDSNKGYGIYGPNYIRG